MSAEDDRDAAWDNLWLQWVEDRDRAWQAHEVDQLRGDADPRTRAEFDDQYEVDPPDEARFVADWDETDAERARWGAL